MMQVVCLRKENECAELILSDHWKFLDAEDSIIYTIHFANSTRSRQPCEPSYTVRFDRISQGTN